MYQQIGLRVAKNQYIPVYNMIIVLLVIHIIMVMVVLIYVDHVTINLDIIYAHQLVALYVYPVGKAIIVQNVSLKTKKHIDLKLLTKWWRVCQWLMGKYIYILIELRESVRY